MTTKTPSALPRLGVNVDHVATLRNARGGAYPDPLRAARLAEQAGADGITAHLREDRRHIRDEDIARLRDQLTVPLNLEMAATEEMVSIALGTVPHACCLVPEKREELTTEGGLDVCGEGARLSDCVGALKGRGIRVSVFIDPDPAQIQAAAEVGAEVIELHTGRYCDHVAARDGGAADRELQRLGAAAEQAAELGLEVHAGHGLTFETVGPVAAIPQVEELNIGHFLISEAVFIGLGEAIATMRRLIAQARVSARGRD